MFWRVAGLATTSPVEVLLDKDDYTLEELLDEDDLIQECKSLNGRLVSYLKAHEQVEKLLRYVVEEPPPGADDKQLYKYPFVSCEVFTCEIDAIFSTLLEDDKLMDLLFSYVDPDRPHGALLSGYFCKVAICLLVRRTPEVMQYIQKNRDVLKKLVDLLDITSIMEVVMRMVGADEQIMMFHADRVQWLAETELLDMIVSKLNPKYGSDMHANAAETLSAVARTAPSALAAQLASGEFVRKLFDCVFLEPQSKSTLINSLSVCITLLDPKRVAAAVAASSQRGMQVQEGTGGLTTAAPETVEGMLAKLGDLLKLLDTTGDERVMPTTYGQLKPPLGIHRLKIIHFVSVLFRSGSQPAVDELMRLGAVSIALRLFFEYPFNNLLHTQVEAIVTTCLETANEALLNHLFNDCSLIARLLEADANPTAPDTRIEPLPERTLNRAGNMGHITRMCNKMVQVAATDATVQAALSAEPKWATWQEETLSKRNQTENVNQWNCGRPAAVEERHLENSDGEDEALRDCREFQLSGMSNNLTLPFSHRYGVFDGEDVEDVFFDDETTEVVINSLHLSDELDSSDEEEGDQEHQTSSSRRERARADSDSDEEDTAAAAAGSGRRPGQLFMTASRLQDMQMLDDRPSSPGMGTGVSSLGGADSDDDEVVVGNDDLTGSPSRTGGDISFDLQPMSPPSVPLFGDLEGGQGKPGEADLFGEAAPFRINHEYDLFGSTPFQASTIPSTSESGGLEQRARDLFADKTPFVPVPFQGLGPHTDPVALPPPPVEPAVQPPAIDLFAAAGDGLGGPAEGINLFADAPAFTAFGTGGGIGPSVVARSFEPVESRERSEQGQGAVSHEERGVELKAPEGKASQEAEAKEDSVDASFNDVNYWRSTYDRTVVDESDL